MKHPGHTYGGFIPAISERGTTVILQQHAGVGFAIILDDVAPRQITLEETCVMHVACEHFGPWPLGAEVAPLLIIKPAATWVMHVVLRIHLLIPSMSLMVCQRLVASAWVAQPEVGRDLCR
jgi:hypothetical protein